MKTLLIVFHSLTGGTEFGQLKAQVGWVQSLYQDILGRLPAMGEWLYYGQQLRSGLSRPAVASNFLISPERESEYVSYLYNSILGRDRTNVRRDPISALGRHIAWTEEPGNALIG